MEKNNHQCLTINLHISLADSVSAWPDTDFLNSLLMIFPLVIPSIYVGMLAGFRLAFRVNADLTSDCAVAAFFYTDALLQTPKALLQAALQPQIA